MRGLDGRAILWPMIQRQRAGRTYPEPGRKPGLGNLVRRWMWRHGFDPLTVRERLAQVDLEREAWKNSYNELVDKVERSGCDLVA